MKAASLFTSPFVALRAASATLGPWLLAGVGTVWAVSANAAQPAAATSQPHAVETAQPVAPTANTPPTSTIPVTPTPAPLPEPSPSSAPTPSVPAEPVPTQPATPPPVEPATPVVVEPLPGEPVVPPAGATQAPPAKPVAPPAPAADKGDGKLKWGATAPKTADAPVDPDDPQPLGRVKFTFSAGYFYGTLAHPTYAGKNAQGSRIEFDFGILGTKRWSVGLALHASQMPLKDNGDGRYIRRGAKATGMPEADAASFRADCTTCVPPAGGGKILIREALMTSVMPRVEYTPMGPSGPFVALGAGVGTINMTGMKVGGAIDARAGYRHRVVNRLALGGIVGFSAIASTKVHAYMPFLAAEIRMN